MSIESDFSRAASFEVALDRLAEATNELGFDAVDYGFMPRALALDGRYNPPEIFSRNFPRRWLAGWTRYRCDDPFLYAGYPRNLPLDWKQVQDADWLSVVQRQAITYLEGIGFSDGLTVPIHLPQGGFAFVTAVTHEREGAWRAQQAQVSDRLFVLAHGFHAAVASRFGLRADTPRVTKLSPRECEMLSHAAAGLSAPETARRVHRSVETVRRQRKSAMQKLGAHTVAQAVAHAMGQGLLSP